MRSKAEHPFFGIGDGEVPRQQVEGPEARQLRHDPAFRRRFLYRATASLRPRPTARTRQKLFIHYLMTEEGIANQMADGKPSGNSKLALPPTRPSGVASTWTSRSRSRRPRPPTASTSARTGRISGGSATRNNDSGGRGQTRCRLNFQREENGNAEHEKEA